jgi:uncharacterized protein (DUF2062 family)
VTVADPAIKPGLLAKVSGWALHHVPTRESIEANRWLRPVAHRILQPSLWRFNRRSVPRGVALGTFCGILFPFAHMVLAAILALPLRANVPTAVGVTLLNNPVTIGPLLWASYHVGHWLLHFDRAFGHQIAQNVKANESMLHWLAQGGPPLIVGLLVIAIGASLAGYFGTSLVWRLRVARRWKNRHR